jgi:predicted DNA-binding protein
MQRRYLLLPPEIIHAVRSISDQTGKPETVIYREAVAKHVEAFYMRDGSSE